MFLGARLYRLRLRRTAPGSLAGYWRALSRNKRDPTPSKEGRPFNRSKDRVVTTASDEMGDQIADHQARAVTGGATAELYLTAKLIRKKSRKKYARRKRSWQEQQAAEEASKQNIAAKKDTKLLKHRI